ncbi:hypothetical protein IWX78_002878 [Mycetocola sp. CAN_C7]|uniref:hypothetical protein n=1 Tax=Mycetocola sp. CAN_C7 TaxID=2787724 RepID=UPI0018C920E2
MYKTTRPATRDAAAGQHLDRLLTALSEQGVKIPGDAVKAQDAWEAADANIRTIRQSADATTATNEIATKLANNKGTITEVLAAASVATLASTTALAGIYNSATIKASGIFAARLESIGWVKHFQPYVTTDIATILDAIPEGFSVEIDNGPASARTDKTAWLRLNPAVDEAWDRLTLVYKTTRHLRLYKIIPSTFQRDDHYEWKGEATGLIRRAGEGYEYSIRDRMIDGDLDSFIWATQHGLTAGLWAEDEVTSTNPTEIEHDDDGKPHTRQPDVRAQHPGELADVVA